MHATYVASVKTIEMPNIINDPATAKNMRLLICGIITAVALSTEAKAQTNSPVPDAQVDRLVDSILAAPIYIDVGFNEQFGSLLGDRLAVAISKKVRLADLRNSDKATRVLLLLRYAFSSPQFIQVEADRNPGTTLLLLDLIEEQSPDSAVSLRAKDLIIVTEALKALRPVPH